MKRLVNTAPLDLQGVKNEGECSSICNMSTDLNIFHTIKKIILLFFFGIAFSSIAFASSPVTGYFSQPSVCAFEAFSNPNDSCVCASPYAHATLHYDSSANMCLNGGNPYYLVWYGTFCIQHSSGGYWSSAPDTTKPLASQCPDSTPTACTSVSCQPKKTAGPPRADGPHTCNPINGTNGNKYWSDVDYQPSSFSRLTFKRQYNSQSASVGTELGTAWHHNYDNALTFNTINNTNHYLINRPDGAIYSFTVSGGTYVSQDPDITDKLSVLVDANNNLKGWQYLVAADDSLETYDIFGKLVSIQDRSGLVQTLTYSDANTPVAIAPRAGLLIRVNDTFGHQLNFTYDSNSRISTMVDPMHGQYQYSYGANNNLASVTYPDNKTKAYLYNETAYTGGTNLPNALTGVVDENGIRYASYYYNALGQAYQEQQAGGVNHYQLSYSTDGSTSSITDPLGTTRTYNLTTILGVGRMTSQTQPGGSGCSGASSNLTYDTNGNIATQIDFNGNKTTYTFDLARNLESSRTEASGTAQARTITTQWHATYRLPIAIAEPLRKTTFSYDPSGNLLNKTVQATSDANGTQGLSATTVGTARTWSYTYNNFGQVLTAIGPRTDIPDITTYSYDSTTGNLLTVTNAAGQITTLSNYDANGRVGTITDPNGMTTNLTYYPRGWLHTKSVSNAGATQTTTYNYDGVGQLINVTLPDNSTITYTYDLAHRLTDIADSLNNSIHYTLDAMGNRVSEQVKDPQATLSRQTTRIYDALNRLQQVTGAVR